jgi:hypothetical protein
MVRHYQALWAHNSFATEVENAFNLGRVKALVEIEQMISHPEPLLPKEDKHEE